MIINNNPLLKILIPNENKVLKEVLKEADIKTILNKNGSNVEDIIKNLFTNLKNNPQNSNDLTKLLKNSSIFKDLGQFSSNIISLKKAIVEEPSLLKYKTSLENFSKDISLINNQNLKSSIKNSGVFLESNIGKLNNKNNLKVNIEKLLVEIKSTLVNNNSFEAKNIVKTIDSLLNNKNISPNLLNDSLKKISSNLKQLFSSSPIKNLITLNNQLENINKTSSLLNSKENNKIDVRIETIVLNEKMNKALNSLKSLIQQSPNKDKLEIINNINKLLEQNTNSLKQNQAHNILKNEINTILKNPQLNNSEEIKNIKSTLSELVNNKTTGNKIQDNLKNVLLEIKTIMDKNTSPLKNEITNNINQLLKQDNNVNSKEILRNIVNKLESIPDQNIKKIINSIKENINMSIDNKSEILNNTNKNTSNNQLSSMLRNNINELKQVLNTSNIPNKMDILNILDKITSSNNLSSNLPLSSNDLSLLKSANNFTSNLNVLLSSLKTIIENNNPNNEKEIFKALKQIENLQGKSQDLLNKNINNIKEDFKLTLLSLKDDIQNLSTQKDTLKQVDKLLTQIDYHQLLSLSSNSNHVYLPFIWDMLEDGNISMKKLKEDKFFCEINLSLKDLGEIKILLSLYDENKLDITLHAQKDNFKHLFKDDLKILKKQINKVGLIPGEIRILELKDEEKIDKLSPYSNTSPSISMGLDIRV